MADVITRFKLETTQYDSKLRDAARSLSDITKQASLAGNEFGKFTQKSVESARAFGDIATSATNSKDKVKELVGAFNDVAKAYNQLTKDQQSTDYGKALAESMTKLKGRIADAKSEMNSTGGILEQLKGKFTLNIDALKLFNAGLTAVKAALDVAKDAFFASEASVDEWGRIMASSEAAYQGFLTALNTGDISGYLNNINDIIQAARQAYNELDRLGTMKTIQGPKISAQQTENERLRSMIQTGRYIAPIDGRKATMKDGQVLTSDQIRTLERQLENGMKTVVSLIGNEVKQTSKAIDAYYNSLAKQNGMSASEFRIGTSSMSEFDKRLQGAKKYQDWERSHTTYDDRTGIGHRDKSVNPYESYKAWSVFRVDKKGDNSLNELVNLIRQRDQQAGQAYGMQSQAFRTINRAEGVTLNKIMGRSGGGSTQATPEEKATGKVANAENDYNQALEQAALELKAGTITEADAKKKELQALERLWNAYGDAYNIYKADKYKDAQENAAKEIIHLGGEVKQLSDAEEAAKKAAKELEAAQKKLTDAENKLAEARKTGSATAVYKAQQEVDRLKGNGPSDTGSMFGNMKQAIQEEIKFDQINVDETTLTNLLKTAIQNGIDDVTVDYQGLQEKIAKGIDIPDSTWQELVNEINEKLSNLGIEPIQIDLETGGFKKLKEDADGAHKSFDKAASAISSVGSAMQQIEDPTAKVIGMIAEAIASIALGFSQAIGKDIGKSGNIWYGIAAAAAGVASMITTISAIHSATGYQNGGVVKGYANGGIASGTGGGMITGMTYSNDQIPIMANAGEVILNRAQAGNIASQLEGGGLQNLRLSATISGEQIRLALNNNGRRTGRGEYVTTNFTRG